MKRTIYSFNLSPVSVSKIDRIAGTLDISRSTALERMLMSMSDSKMSYHAKRKPVYVEDEELDHGNDET